MISGFKAFRSLRARDCEKLLTWLDFFRKHNLRAKINSLFTMGCFFFPPVLGSAVSFLYNGGGIWSVVELGFRPSLFSFNRAMLLQASAIYAYCAAYFMASAANGSFSADATGLLQLVTLLFFPFSYSTWSGMGKNHLVVLAVNSSAAGCFVACVLAAGEYYWQGVRAEGGAGNAIVFAMVVCLAVMVCLAGMFSGIVKNQRVLLAAVFAGTLAIVYSGSRGIWLAAIIGAVAILLIYQRHWSWGRIKRLLPAIAIAGVIAAAVGFHVAERRLDATLYDINRVLLENTYDTPIGFRVAIWQIGLDAFLERPIFGHGAGASTPMIKDGLEKRFNINETFNHFHNGFLTALVEAGVFGAAALGAIFLVAMRNASRTLYRSSDATERFGAVMLIAVVVTYLTGGLTGIQIGHDILDAVLMVFLTIGTYLACGNQAGKPEVKALAQ